MSDFGKNLMENLVQLKGKSGDHVTRFLKKCGGKNGKMVDGLIDIVKIFESKITHARKSGIAIGSVGTLALGGGVQYAVKQHKKKKEAREQMNRITKILNEEVEVAKLEEMVNNENLLT